MPTHHPAGRRRRAAGAPLACAAALACLPLTLRAAPSEDVIVTASRAETRLQDMPLQTTVVTREEIQRSPAGTLDQLLRNVPGLLISGAPAYTTDPTGQNIKFRGMDKKVLVLVDGVPVLDPFYTTVQWFKLPLSAVERVEVVRGGGSSLWGNLAVGGVINVVTRRPKADAGEAQWSVGSLGTWTAALARDFAVSEAFSLSVAADGFTADGYNNTPPELRAAYWPGRDTSSATSGNVRMTLRWQPSADFGGFLRLGQHRQNEDIGGYAYGSNLQRATDAQLGATRRLGADGRLDFSAFAQHVRFDKYNGAACYAAATYACGASVSGAGASATQQVAPVLQYASSYDLNTYRERGGSLVWSQRLESPLLRELQLGADYRAISGEDAQQTYRAPTAALPAVLRVQRTNEGAGRQTFEGLFTQLKLRPLEGLELTASARVDRFRNADGRALQTNYSNVAAPVAGATTGGPVPGLTKTAFDPSLQLRYELAESLDLRAAAYKAFRAPGLNNLYRSFGSSSITIANPLLGPETLVGKELGLDWRSASAGAGVTLFDARVRDVVATYAITAATPIPDAVKNICGDTYTGTPNAACPGTVSFYTNGQDQRSRGVEVDAHWTPGAGLTLAGYATLTHATYTRSATGDPTGVQLSLVPKGVAGVSLAWQASERWTTSFDLRYNSPMTLSSLTLSPGLRQGGYTVASAATRWRVDEHLEVALGVGNLGGKRYTDGSASNPQGVSLAAPRTARVSFDVGF